MVRFFDVLVEIWDRLRGLFGFHRLTRKGRGADLEGRGVFRRFAYFLRPLLMLLILVYFGTMIWRFAFIRGDEMDWPQQALAAMEAPAAPAAGGQSCEMSRVVAMQQALVDILVNRNDWAPATPQFKIGVFGLLSWEATPFFDNKASFQRGALSAARRMSLELTDVLGRVRGTSGADPNLEAARGLLSVDERTWLVNPFDSRLPFLATSAASSYRNAIGQFGEYNRRLATCEALFDARADNLFALMDRITADLGSNVEQVAVRSLSKTWDPATKTFVEGTGNNLGVFDLRADNLFHEARGRMFAYHGLLQAARIDFAEVIAQRNLGDVWDRMESHVAEAAVLQPLIVSNGDEDGLLAPAHLSAMAQKMLRARANMTEIRDILAR